MDDSQPELSIRTSPRKALAAAASQATEDAPFESQLRDAIPEATIQPPAEGSRAATEATSEAIEGGDDTGFDDEFTDNFDGIDWKRLPRFTKPLRTLKRNKSWVYQYGYRVASLREPHRTFFVCKYCHHRKIFCAYPEVTKSTSNAINHLAQKLLGHGYDRKGKLDSITLPRGQTTLKMMTEGGVDVPQGVANELGNFDVQRFRYAAVTWLVDNNHPLREFETPAFRQMIEFANPEAADALWVSHNSVASFVMRLYRYMEPQVVQMLSSAISKIHISFDGWTTKGGKRGFFGVVAHFADADGTIRDLPIALPQLTGAHTGERIAEVVGNIIDVFGITRSQLGYFVLDNAYANDTAVTKLAQRFEFTASHHRLRCGPHTLNLVGQMIIFGFDKDAYDNDQDEHKTEAAYLQEWRQQGPLGVLIDIINYIQTPQQHDLFADCQRRVNAKAPDQKQEILEPVKPVVTRWNSFHDTFVRAAKLHNAVDEYAQSHIERTMGADAYARSRNNKLTKVPAWMRSNGLTADDWAVITQYISVLEPLKEATKRLEARGKAGRFGAIYEVIPVFEAVLAVYEQLLKNHESVDYNANSAPEDHLPINLRAAWAKLNAYYTKLDESPAYFAATCLHPYYKNYCENSWRDKPSWLEANNAGLKQLWAFYKPQIQRQSRPPVRLSSGINDAINALVNAEPYGIVEVTEMDELERWRRFELRWTQEQFEQGSNPVSYWISLRPKYPNLARMAIDILTIPASSCECERLFSELGDLLEPRRRKIGSQLLAAIQCIRSWRDAGFKPPSDYNSGDVTDAEKIETEDAYARSRNNKLPAAPDWMRSDGINAHDWQVIAEYIDVLRPLKQATKRLEGRGKSGAFGAIAEVIPVFEYLLGVYEDRLQSYEDVIHDEHTESPEDHLAINLRAALVKAREYYNKLDLSPAYYAATILHPRYKSYLDAAWADKPDWLESSNRKFQHLWAEYKSLPKPRLRPKVRHNDIDDAINSFIEPAGLTENEEDEYEAWKRSEPIASEGVDPIKYWVGLRDRYPSLSKFAIDMLSIPGSSCECERLFSELGDLLEPRRRSISPQLLAAIQCDRRWIRAGFGSGEVPVKEAISDEEMDAKYGVHKWDIS
ncbi:Dimer-Tnp-hAT domain containing protein [Pyrenophora tritici-repentis]|uniref:Dimer-Tnp-hAT domain containing protein n=2 Tax=Pyrenophora tritici-repentis TaxID=45151 RepID=A0A922NRV0_9PLEO|nr:Dimer-Tnp-hAT domain containing protein [Pyrenophora tritici-repentis]